MKNKILYVEDDIILQNELAEFLERRNYSVDTADHGAEAMSMIEKSGVNYSAIILDLRMSVMSGEDMLVKLREKQISLPPIIVLSAYFNQDAVSLCLVAGVKCLFGKPFEHEHLEKVLNAIIYEDEIALLQMAEDEDSQIHVVTFPQTVLFKLTPDLRSIVESRDPVGPLVAERERALRRFFLEQTSNSATNTMFKNEPIFIVARRWNSWYPSYFNVHGGSYAISGMLESNSRPKTAIIDPGFRCLDILKEMGVSVRDIESCVVTHNHPDHVAGIFELMASRHALDLKTTGWCNETTTGMFGDCSGFGLEINQLKPNIESKLIKYSGKNNENRKVSVVGFHTSHREIGRNSLSLGLEFKCSRNIPEFDSVISKAIVLGDTEYKRAQNPNFPEILTSEGVKFVVLHVGSVQMKQREGGHLYFPGLKRLLNDMDASLERKGLTKEPLLVLLSEWGLEHATASQISDICGTILPAFDHRNPMIETANLLNREFKSIHVIPADIGLMIGMESGLVYLADGSTINAKEVEVQSTQNGLIYNSI